MPYRFTDSFWSSGRKLSAVLPDGKDMMSRVTPSGFFAPRTGADEAAFVAAAGANAVRDDRDYVSTVLARNPRHFWYEPAADLLSWPDLGYSPDPLKLMATPITGINSLSAGPVVRSGGRAAHYVTTVTAVDSSRYKAMNWSRLESSAERPNWYQYTYEIWYRPNLSATPLDGQYLGRSSTVGGGAGGGIYTWHSGMRPNARVYKTDGVAFLDASAPVVAGNLNQMDVRGALTGTIQYVASYDGLTVRLYMNGALVDATTNDYVPDQGMFDPVGGHWFVFPLSTGAAVNFPKGDVGAISYYDRALSDAEIAENYAVGAPVAF